MVVEDQIQLGLTQKYYQLGLDAFFLRHPIHLAGVQGHDCRKVWPTLSEDDCLVDERG